MDGALSEVVRLVENNIEKTLTFYRLPRQHHKNLKSTNMLQRFNEEIKHERWWCAYFRARPRVCG